MSYLGRWGPIYTIEATLCSPRAIASASILRQPTCHWRCFGRPTGPDSLCVAPLWWVQLAHRPVAPRPAALPTESCDSDGPEGVGGGRLGDGGPRGGRPGGLGGGGRPRGRPLCVGGTVISLVLRVCTFLRVCACSVSAAGPSFPPPLPPPCGVLNISPCITSMYNGRTLIRRSEHNRSSWD